jgi:hypothetical protein
MTLQISFTLDEEADLEGLVGDFSITDGERVFSRKATYVDSWLEALIDGLESIESGNATATVEIVEEPLRIDLAVTPTGLVVDAGGADASRKRDGGTGDGGRPRGDQTAVDVAEGRRPTLGSRSHSKVHCGARGEPRARRELGEDWGQVYRIH